MALRDQVSVPPEFEGTSARLVDVQFDLNGDRLHGTLVKLSQVISRNAKFTNTVHEEVQSLRTYVDMQLNKVNRSIGILDESTRSLKEQQFRIHDEVRAVAGVTVKKEDYEKDQRKTRGQINEMNEWITQVKKAMENTKQEITTVLDDYLPKWYKTVADDWAASVEGQISTMRQQLEQNIRSDTRVLQDTLIDRMEQVETKTQGDLAQYSAQMAARAEHDEKFDARAAEVDRSLSAISAANDHLTVMVGDFSSRTLPRLAEIEASYEDLLTLFGLEIPDIKKAVADQRFLSREVASSIDDQEEHSIMGTPDHNAPSTSLAPPSTNDTASAIVSTITVDGLTTPEAAPPGSTTTGSRPPRAARPKKPAASSVKRSQSSPPHTSITRSSPTQQSQGQLLSSIRSMNDSVTSNPAATTTPTHSSSTVDRRTELLLSLPWTRQLFGDLLVQIQARSQETGADLSNQVDQQFGTIRAELNDKVGISKLQQLLVQNRDDKLYSTLDTCKKEIESLKQTKVDQKMFDGALSTKVDVSQLKAKADTEMVQTVASHTNEQVAEMRLVTDRLDKQLRELTGAGGGGSSTGGGGSQFHSLHGASGGSHGHQQHGGGGHHSTAAHTSTSGGQRRSLSKPGSSGTTPQGHNLPPVSHASATGTQNHHQQQPHQQQQRTPQSTRLTPQQAGFAPPTSATSSSSRGAMEDSIHNQPSSPQNHRHDDTAEQHQQGAGPQQQHRRGSTTPRNSSNNKRSPRGGGAGGAETGRPSTQQQQQQHHTRSPGRGDDIHQHDRPRTQGGDATSSRGRPKPDLSDMLFRMTESEFQNETKNIPASPPGSSHAQSRPTTSGKGEL